MKKIFVAFSFFENVVVIKLPIIKREKFDDYYYSLLFIIFIIYKFQLFLKVQFKFEL